MIEGARETPAARRPATSVRVLFLLLALAGGFLLLRIAFPPGAPDRFPVLALAMALALLSAQRGTAGLVAFSFLFPASGLAARLFGGEDALAWPLLLFAGFAAGWSFRFVYDFESRPDSSSADGILRALVAIWAGATAVALAQARTLWAAMRGLSGRMVNGAGLPESAAERESLLAFATLAAGAAFFFLLRRAGETARRRALIASVAGVGVSALAAQLEWLGALPADPRPFWRLTGRLAGGAADPNSLGLLCAMALPLLAALGRGQGTSAARRVAAAAGVLLVSAGLVFSGSRSGLLIVLLALAIFLALRPLSARVRWAAVAAAAAGAAVLWLAAGRAGSLSERLRQTFDPALPLEYRVSARPVLWRSAVRMFREAPLSGGGMAAFSWRLPDLTRAEGRSLPLRDNPGSGYVQALAETGLPGLAVTLALAVAFAAGAARAVRSSEASVRAAAGCVVIAFLLALALGSHWMAPDASLFFFLLASIVATEKDPAAPPARRRWLAAAVAIFFAAALVSVARTARAEATFRYGRLVGFHPEERGEAGPYRWTRRRSAVRVFPGESLRLALAHYPPGTQPVAIDAWADGRRIWHRTLAPGGAVSLRLVAAPDRPSDFLFRLSSSFVPKRLLLSEDRRELGVVAVFP